MKSYEQFDKYIEERKASDPGFKRYYEANQNAQNLAHMLVRWRKHKKLTQAQLAKMTGKSQSQIARIEAGNSNVTLGTISEIVSATGDRVQVNIVSDED